VVDCAPANAQEAPVTADHPSTNPATVELSGRLAAGVDALRPLLAALGPDDVVVLQVPPGTTADQATTLYRLLSLSLGSGASFTVVDPGRRLHLLQLPLAWPPCRPPTCATAAGPVADLPAGEVLRQASQAALRRTPADELAATVLGMLGLPAVADRLARGQPLVEVQLRLQFGSPPDAVSVLHEVERG
jgi:hypothetical protein